MNKEDWRKVAVGAMVAAAGAVVTYLLNQLGNMDFGANTPFVVALVSVVLNAARKWLSGPSA